MKTGEGEGTCHDAKYTCPVIDLLFFVLNSYICEILILFLCYTGWVIHVASQVTFSFPEREVIKKSVCKV
jgi:hypothetical protein